MLLGVVLAAALGVVLGASALPASADDGAPATPGFTPPPLPDPSDPSDSGPTYLITPGVGGSALPAPAEPKAVEKAKKAERSAGADRPARQAPSTAPPSRTPGVVAGPVAPVVRPAAAPEEVGLLLRAFAALVAMVVMCEVLAVRRAVFRRRRRAVTAG